VTAYGPHRRLITGDGGILQRYHPRPLSYPASAIRTNGGFIVTGSNESVSTHLEIMALATLNTIRLPFETTGGSGIS